MGLNDPTNLSYFTDRRYRKIIKKINEDFKQVTFYCNQYFKTGTGAGSMKSQLFLIQGKHLGYGNWNFKWGKRVRFLQSIFKTMKGTGSPESQFQDKEKSTVNVTKLQNFQNERSSDICFQPQFQNRK